MARLSGGRDDAELVQMCSGDRTQADRLIELELDRAPGLARREATRRAVSRLRRDRGR